MEPILSYYDFAENSRKFLMKALQENEPSNDLCVIAQNTCERYLKYLIEKFYRPNENDLFAIKKKADILYSHNLKKLCTFLEKYMDISIDKSTRRSILLADGYYISARYPGEDSFFVSDADKKDCIEALEACKSFVDKTIDVLNERQADRDEI